MDPYTDKQETPSPQPVISGNTVTPESNAPPGNINDTLFIDEAIADIRRYSFTPQEDDDIEEPQEGDNTTNKDNANTLLLLGMFGTNNTTVLPELEMEAWPYHNEKTPNPLSITKARLILVGALKGILCADTEYGYAWMVESERKWLARDGVMGNYVVPTVSVSSTEYTVKNVMAFNVQDQKFQVYFHLSQKCKAKLLDWFDKAPGKGDAYGVARERIECTYEIAPEKRRYLQDVEE